MALATSAATDTMFAAAANADTASTANVTFAAGVQDAPIVLAPAIACAVSTPRRFLAPAIACADATPRRSSRRVKNLATTHYSKKATVLNCNSAMQASAAIRSSANCDERSVIIDLEHSVVCGNAVERNRGNAIERATRGKSGCESKCRFPNTGGLHRTSGDAPLETHLEMAHENENSVVCGNAVEQNQGNAVERATRSKSRCESKCRFPNTGGLHRTSGDALLETHPSFCYVHKRNSSSSKRTQAASRAFLVNRNESARHSTKHRRILNANRKKDKQHYHLKDVKICKTALKKVKLLDLDYIRKNVVVCDGGENESDGIQNRLDIDGATCLRVRDGDIWVSDTKCPSIGLRHILPGASFPTFIRLPRSESLAIMNNGRTICHAMILCALSQNQSLSRGKKNHVFTEGDNKYCCVGTRPGRAERGIHSGLYRVTQGFPCKEWDNIHKVLKRAEHAFDTIMNTEIIRHISCARSRVRFDTMSPSPCSPNQKSARYYNGLGFGLNVFLRSHIDRDFTMSIVQAHIDNHDYQLNDRIVCYFAFPRIGIAVALRPGDFLLFNPQEPHSISSSCKAEDEIFCASSYLKTAIVGLNDNSNTVV